VFSRKDYAGPPLVDLIDVIEYVKPTALIGLSTIGGIFTPTVLQTMAALNPRPIVFPLSNPVRLSECTYEDAMKHTNGSVIFASGSPFAPIGDRHPGQG
jgi:malate dehydrogenase (oxaloacetate-decarboxylating)(NADP+)